MTDALKVLGQANPAAATLTPLYTVPAATQATSSSIVVCNRANVPTTFRVSVAIAGAADDPKQYIAYDAVIQPNDSISLQLGVSLAATDVVRCYALLANLSFNMFGVELT